MASSTITIRLDADEKRLISDYAKAYGTTTSEFVRRTVLEFLEDQLDLQQWYEAKREFDRDPRTLSAEEIAEKYL